MGRMVGRTRKAPKRRAGASASLFIGQWLRALGHRQIDVVRGTGLNEGYLSELVAGRKRNPSAEVLLEIAEFLGIPMQYLYREPPDREFIQEATAIDPAVLAKLRSTNQ